MATEDFSGTLANWTQWYPAWGQCTIESGVLKFGSGQDVGIRWSGAGSFGASQFSAVDIAGATWISQYAGVGVRMTGSDGTRSGYFARLFDNAASAKQLDLLKVVNGTPTVLKTTTFATGSSFRLRVEVEESGANALLRVFVGATQITALDHTDTSPLTGGTPGLIGNGGTLSADNWEGDTYTPPPSGPVITGPSGAAGAASITTSTAENQNVAGVWTATGTGTWSLSGTDAALLSISGGTVTLAAGTFDADAATGGRSSYSFTVNYGTASQAVTLNITNINEAPSFIGPAIGALVFTMGAPITPVPMATRAVDPEGLAITATIVESLAGTGLSVVSGQLQGTPAAVQAATTYTPRFADPAGNATNGTQFTIQIQAAGTPPSITTQPQSQTVTAGANVTFSVAATGSGTLSYQWRRNGVNIAGANSASYTLATVLGDSGAVFSVVVSGDTAPPATSANATLTVNAAPTFSALTDVIAESGINLAAGTTVFWTWYPSGTSQVNAQGRALISHTQAGAGMVLLGTRPGPTVADDRVYLDFLTLA